MPELAKLNVYLGKKGERKVRIRTLQEVDVEKAGTILECSIKGLG